MKGRSWKEKTIIGTDERGEGTERLQRIMRDFGPATDLLAVMKQFDLSYTKLSTSTKESMIMCKAVSQPPIQPVQDSSEEMPCGTEILNLFYLYTKTEERQTMNVHLCIHLYFSHSLFIIVSP